MTRTHKTIALLCTAVFVFVPLTLFAQGFVPLEAIPGATDGSQTSFPSFLNALFKILIGAGAILAVLMLVVGGVQYMTSEAFGMKEQGRNRMKGAVGGLILLLAAWLILYTINPDLVNFRLFVG